MAPSASKKKSCKIKLPVELSQFIKEFKDKGVSIQKIATIKDFFPKSKLRGAWKAVYFKKFPIKTQVDNKMLSMESLKTFHDSNITYDPSYDFDEVIKDDNIRIFLVGDDEDNEIQAMTGFFSSEIGHIIVFMIVKEDQRQKNLAK